MVQRAVGRNLRLQQRVQHAIVKVETLRIARTGPRRKNTRPRNREPVGRQSQIRHQRDVFLVAVIVVIRHIASIPVVRLARHVREGVPDRRSASILMHRALHLVRSRCRAPQKSLRKRLRRASTRFACTRRGRTLCQRQRRSARKRRRPCRCAQQLPKLPPRKPLRHLAILLMPPPLESVALANRYSRPSRAMQLSLPSPIPRILVSFRQSIVPRKKKQTRKTRVSFSVTQGCS